MYISLKQLLDLFSFGMVQTFKGIMRELVADSKFYLFSFIIGPINTFPFPFIILKILFKVSKLYFIEAFHNII